MSTKKKDGKNTFFYSRPEVLVCLFLVVTTLAVYWQVGNHEFINLDDGRYVAENPQVQKGLSHESVIWAFTTTEVSNWHPVTWLSHMLDFELYGLNPKGHHLTNVFFHLVNTLLLFLVLKWMTGALWRSGFVAALFALHPLHVESVAWVAERKDVLSTLFWMLTLWAYLRYVQRPDVKRYLLTLISLALGLMAKPMLVTLPCVLLLLDYWPLERIQLGQSGISTTAPGPPAIIANTPARQAVRLLLEKIPFFALGVISGIITFVVQKTGGAVGVLEVYPFKLRIANAALSYVSYITKMIWPHNLAVFYPHPGQSLPMWQAAAAAFLLVVASVAVIRSGRRYPYLPVGWFWYLGTLVPVIGLVQVGAQAMADRYTYVPLIGLFIMVVWGIADLTTGWRHRNAGLAWASAALLAAVMLLTWNQLRYWKNSTALFEHALAVTENNYVAHNNLGTALNEQGRAKEAMVHFIEAVRIRPNFSWAHNNLGNALSREGRNKEALGHFYKALELEPNMPGFHLNLGNALEIQGKIKEAASHYSKALQLDPTFAEAHFNLGNLLARQGRVEEAISSLSRALKCKPNFAEAHNSLGAVLAYRGELDEAIAHFTEALRIKPGFIKARNNLSMALQQRERRELISGTTGDPES